MSLEWREQLSVGNDLIDSDHKHMIELINQTEKCLKTRRRDEMSSVLDGLAKYAKAHFAREETVARAVGYPQLAQLHDSHESLLTKLDTVVKEIGEEWSDAAMDHFSAFLREWLINHVIKEDMLLKPLLKKHSPRFDPR